MSCALDQELWNLRLARRLSLGTAAALANVAKGTLSGWENGASRPRGAALVRLLDTLEADPRTRARLIHAAEGGAAGQFHVENFGPPPRRDASPASAPLADAVQVRYGARSFGVRPGETVLEAASRQTVVIPCGCASGICGTCITRVVEGRVEMRHQGGISPEEEDAGYILACSARPRTDLVLTPPA